jgi:FAD binding domain-containing protein
MSTEYTDVLIVRAGPVGLWLSCEPARSGVRVRLVERRISRSPHSRALTLHARTIENFAMRGVEQRWLDEGRPVPTGHYAMLAGRLDLTRLDSDFNFALFLPQLQTEKFLVDLAAELGVQVEDGCELVSLTPRAEDVSAVLRNRDVESEIVARFVVGCDGGFYAAPLTSDHYRLIAIEHATAHVASLRSPCPGWACAIPRRTVRIRWSAIGCPDSRWPTEPTYSNACTQGGSYSPAPANGRRSCVRPSRPTPSTWWMRASWAPVPNGGSVRCSSVRTDMRHGRPTASWTASR